ncbi:RNase H-like domain found in reverse transcriptase [Popillia japonica]|uniref:RNase H-like domain found in reverse transcriptase n=1 Tax=Popillia japonica TaxID=7064 RepID=A0AAW1LB12_POPJA
MAPINDLLKGKKKKQHIEWTTDAEKSFITIKQALVSAPILRSPDFSKSFTIQCDASDTGVGGVLTQVSDGEEVVIAFCSRSLSKAERNYSVTERELVALLFSLEKFRPYVEGTHFKVITDHYSLLWLRGLKELVALLFSLEKFRPYVEGTHFKVITDHYSLLWLRGLKEPTGKLARWAIKLQQYS